MTEWDGRQDMVLGATEEKCGAVQGTTWWRKWVEKMWLEADSVLGGFGNIRYTVEM